MEQELDLNDLDPDIGASAHPRVTRYARRASQYRPAGPAPRSLPGDTPEDVAFWDSLRQQSIATRDQPEPEIVLADPERIKRARTLATTLQIPFSAAYQGEQELSASMEKRDPGWTKEAGTRFMRGVGNTYVQAAQAAQYLGMSPESVQAYDGFGKYLQEAYVPKLKPPEVSWRNFADPQWYATTFAEAAPTTLALIPAGMLAAYVPLAAGAAVTGATTMAFAKTALGVLLGGAAATAVSRPMESALEAVGAREEALAQGKSDAEADAIADTVFHQNLSLAGLDVAQIAASFTPLRYLGRLAPKALAARVLATTGKIGAVAFSEAGEEALQSAFTQAAIEKKGIWETLRRFNPEMQESAMIGAVFGVGLPVGGSVFTALSERVTDTMAPAMAEQFENEKQTALAQGLTEQQAEVRALDRIAETEEGRAHIEKTVKDLKDLAEGREPARVTVEEQEAAIEQAVSGQESGVRSEESGVSSPESPDSLLLTAEEFDAIARGETSIEDVLGIEAVSSEELVVSSPVSAPLTPDSLLLTADQSSFLVSEDAYAAAQARLKEKTSGFHAGVDPTALADMVVIGAYHLERGVRTFAEWSKQMIGRFGEAIRPHLQNVWEQSNDMLKRGVRSGMAEPMAAAEAIEGARQPAGQVKKQVRRVTGLEKISRLVREDEALRASLKKAEQAARIAYKVGTTDALARARADFNARLAEAQRRAEGFGFREGFKLGEKMTRKELVAAFKDSQRSAQETRQALFELIQENLPTDLRGKFLQSIVGEVSKRKQESILRRIEQTKELLDKKELLDDLEGIASFKGSVALDYTRKIQDAIKDIDLKKMSPRTRRKLEDLKLYADMHGMPSGIRPELLRQLERLEKTPAADLTPDDLRPLVEQLKHLEQLGKLKLQLKNKYDERQRQAALNKLVKSTVNLDPKSKEMRGVFKGYLETLQAPRVAEAFDGGKFGENYKLVRDLRQATLQAARDDSALLNNAFDELAQLGLDTDAASQDFLLRLMVNIRAQEGATDQVATLMEHYGLTDMPKLKPGEQQVIDILKRTSNAKTQQLAATFEEINNEPFPILESRILPLKYEGEFRVGDTEAIVQRYSRRTQTEQGMTIQRKKGVKRLPRIDVFAVFEEGIRESNWYVNVQPAIDNVARLVKTKDYVNTAGEVAANWWKDHLDTIAQRGRGALATRLPFDALLRKARGNINQAVLGYKVGSIMVQPFAVGEAMAYAAAKRGWRAGLRVGAEVSKSWIVPGYAKEYIEQSPILQERATGELAVAEALEAAGRSKKLWSQFLRGGMRLLQKADVRTAAGAQQAFEKILVAEGATAAEAKIESGMLMELTQSSSDVAFMPHILARGEIAKTIFTFQSFVMNRWGLVIHDLVHQGVIKGDYKGKFRAIFGLAIVVATAIAGDEATRYLYELISRRKMPDRPLWQDIMFALPEQVPYFGQLFNQFSAGRLRAPPLGRAIEQAAGVKDIIAEIFADDPDGAKMARKALRATEAVATVGAGVPGTAQAFDLIEAIFFPPEKPGGKIRKRPIRKGG